MLSYVCLQLEKRLCSKFDAQFASDLLPLDPSEDFRRFHVRCLLEYFGLGAQRDRMGVAAGGAGHGATNTATCIAEDLDPTDATRDDSNLKHDPTHAGSRRRPGRDERRRQLDADMASAVLAATPFVQASMNDAMGDESKAAQQSSASQILQAVTNALSLLEFEVSKHLPPSAAAKGQSSAEGFSLLAALSGGLAKGRLVSDAPDGNAVASAVERAVGPLLEGLLQGAASGGGAAADQPAAAATGLESELKDFCCQALEVCLLESPDADEVGICSGLWKCYETRIVCTLSSVSCS